MAPTPSMSCEGQASLSPPMGSVSVNRHRSRWNFTPHTFLDLKGEGGWVKKQEKGGGREKTWPGQEPAPLASATRKMAPFPSVPSGPALPALLHSGRVSCGHCSLSRAVYRAMVCSVFSSPFAQNEYPLCFLSFNLLFFSGFPSPGSFTPCFP